MTGLAVLGDLAVAGGAPVRTAPVPRWPRFGVDEAEAAREVLLSGRVNYWTGDQGRRFEEEFAGWVGARHAVAVANGTVALELALDALGVAPGGEVIVPAATFIATASAVVARGAVPVVVDVDPASQCLTAQTVQAALTRRTAAVVVVHLAGWVADVAAIAEVVRPHGVRVLEDCAQAHGARREGRAVGTLGDAAAWSFCQDKILSTAGEGGAVTTDDPAVWRRCWERKDHGKNWDVVNDGDRPPGFRWLHDVPGTNARMTEVQAAVGRRQLTKVDGWVAQRRRHAHHLRDALSGLAALRLPEPPSAVEHAWYRFWLHVVPERLAPGWDRDRVVAAVAAEGVPCAHGGCTEIHREGVLAPYPPPHPIDVGARLGRTSMVLPVHPALDDADVADLARAVRKVMTVASAR